VATLQPFLLTTSASSPARRHGQCASRWGQGGRFPSIAKIFLGRWIQAAHREDMVTHCRNKRTYISTSATGGGVGQVH